MDLSPEAVRVLGALVEKALATPQQYPLSENALLAACNQSTNREPVVRYDVDVLRRALVELREQGLARTVHRPGERATKHRHQIDEALEVDEAQVAVLAVLLLRGPQTPGELRTRVDRLHTFGGLDDVQAVLDRLQDHSKGPLVRRLERQPGQKEARYAHLLGDPHAEAVRSAVEAEDRDAHDVTPRARGPLDVLAQEVADLGARVERLEAALDAERAT